MTQAPDQGAYATSEEWREVLNKGHLGQNWLRRIMRTLPSDPRCKVCNNPFGGVGGRVCGALGMSRSKKNPNVCALCCENMPRGGAEVEAVILFADVRNSTEIAEKLGPTRYSEALGRFYAAVTDVLIRHDAIIDKLIGDEVMAFFVPGHAGPNFKHRAVEAARTLMKKTGQYRKDGAELPVGTGMESGIAFAGNIGGNEIVDFTIVGDPVNVSARIQAEAKAGELLIGENLFQSVEEHYPGSEVRTLKVKGKSDPIRVYSLPT